MSFWPANLWPFLFNLHVNMANLADKIYTYLEKKMFFPRKTTNNREEIKFLKDINTNPLKKIDLLFDGSIFCNIIWTSSFLMDINFPTKLWNLIQICISKVIHLILKKKKFKCLTWKSLLSQIFFLQSEYFNEYI